MKRDQLIQKNKNTIVEMIYENDKLAITISQYLSDKLNLSYGYITNVFGNTYSSIENFIIIQKIERARN
jgi:hypothetical protein